MPPAAPPASFRLLAADAQLLASLRLGEGLRLAAYPDPKSGGDPWTCGYGSTDGVKPNDTWTMDLAESALVRDAANAIVLLDKNLPWWRGLAPNRQRVLVEMCFNMGWRSADGKHGLSTFVNTLGKMHTGDVAGAAAGLIASQWYRDVGARAVRLIAQWRQG